jgi:hypothetical protein
VLGTDGSGQSGQSQATSSTPQYGPLGSNYPTAAETSAARAEVGPEAPACPEEPDQAATAPAGGDATATDDEAEDAASAAPGATALITPSPASEKAGTRLLSASGPCAHPAGAAGDSGSRPLPQEEASAGTVRLR